MEIHQIFFKNTLRNFSYLISFNDGASYCVDPYQSTEVIDYLNKNFKGSTLKGIINTHDHCDHYSGNEDLASIYNCQVMAHEKAMVPFKNRNLLDQEIIYQVSENETQWTLRSIFTPGHTLSHICVLLEKNGAPFAIFTGDCFFNAGVGNCHHGGDPEILYETIDSVFNNLPDEILIYPGHEYLKRNLEFTCFYEPSNLVAQKFLQSVCKLDLDQKFFINSMKTEREINTFLRLESSDLISGLNKNNSNKKQVFLTLRNLRNSW
jgi:hydroxyacylglutathione hydrolase